MIIAFPRQIDQSPKYILGDRHFLRLTFPGDHCHAETVSPDDNTSGVSLPLIGADLTQSSLHDAIPISIVKRTAAQLIIVAV